MSCSSAELHVLLRSEIDKWTALIKGRYKQIE